MITILDGAIGTALEARGHNLNETLWSGTPLLHDPSPIAALHAAYAGAGATVHTAATFRTQPRRAGFDAARLTRLAVEQARSAIPSGHRVAGSMAPLADCYQPEAVGHNAAAQHEKMASILHDSGVDLILVETFANPEEAVLASRAAAKTGLPVWTALTAGFKADLLTPAQLASAGRRVVQAGSHAVLVNCVPFNRTLEYVAALADVIDGAVPIGAYANAGLSNRHANSGTESLDRAFTKRRVAQYVAEAVRWADAGCTIIGGCCGTDVAHIIGLHETFTRG